MNLNGRGWKLVSYNLKDWGLPSEMILQVLGG